MRSEAGPGRRSYTDDPTEVINGSAARSAARAGRTVVAMVSVLVLGLTGYAWATYNNLAHGLTTSDVIDSGAGGDKPADGATDILLVGMDSRTDAQGHQLPRELLDPLNAGDDTGEANTDTLILVHIPNNGGKAVAISLPRDSYVDIPGYGKHKINSAFARAKVDAMNRLQSTVKDQAQLEVQSNQEGDKELIKTIQGLTGITVDHFAAVNLFGFSEITKAVGGVDVCLLRSVHDDFSGANFKAGQQTISGPDALKFVRQRHGLPNGDLDRIKRQQVFMASMAHKILSTGTLTNPTSLSNLITAVKKSVVLDQGWDILGFAKQMQGLTAGNINFMTVPITTISLKTPYDGDAVGVDPQKVRAFVQALTNGQDPSQAQAAATEPDKQADTATTSATVDVHNATGITGLANKVLDVLEQKGFTRGDIGNAATRSRSLIRYPKGGQEAAQQVAQALGGGISMELDTSVESGHVDLYLGKDYSGPGAQRMGAPAALQLDGGTQPRQQPAPAQPSPGNDQPITADGTTCVN
ncbi:LCP family protein [Gandjariella thermophila]|uniref:LytTR family transcriptional regulator n=1 Tax=Gandjariella thermophila TaxID=1931992 RepID=A0A4D4JIV5_9PSEU|nr:LCP family protein [Gandjariella thermophila]GDY33823.1 LytTR family transcriptional regulator [Gandjariella thermophila]